MKSATALLFGLLAVSSCASARKDFVAGKLGEGLDALMTGFAGKGYSGGEDTGSGR